MKATIQYACPPPTPDAVTMTIKMTIEEARLLKDMLNLTGIETWEHQDNPEKFSPQKAEDLSWDLWNAIDNMLGC